MMIYPDDICSHLKMLSKNLEITLNRSFEIAKAYSHELVTLEHLLLSLLEDDEVRAVLNRSEVDVPALHSTTQRHLNRQLNLVGVINDDPRPSTLYNHVLELSSINKTIVSPGDLFLTIAKIGDTDAARILGEANLTYLRLQNYFNASIASLNPVNDNNEISNFCYEITSEREVFCRESEIEALQRILMRSSKSNPLLIGEAGVGKSALIEGFAHGIRQGRYPNFIGYKLYLLDVAQLLSGTKYRGDFEERINQVIKYFEGNNKSILFIDEIHMIVGAGAAAQSNLDISNIMKPALARGSIKVIGATTPIEYSRFIATDKALSRRLQPLELKEPSEEQAILILKGVSGSLEAHHGIIINDHLLERVVADSRDLSPGRKLPDGAIDILDEICAQARLEGVKQIDIKYYNNFVSHKFADLRFSFGECELQALANELKNRIIGQDSVLPNIVDYLRMFSINLGVGHLQIINFSGANSCGKTTAAMTIVEVLRLNHVKLHVTNTLDFSLAEMLELLQSPKPKVVIIKNSNQMVLNKLSSLRGQTILHGCNIYPDNLLVILISADSLQGADEVFVFEELSKLNMIAVFNKQLSNLQSRLSQQGLELKLDATAKQALAEVIKKKSPQAIEMPKLLHEIIIKLLANNSQSLRAMGGEVTIHHQDGKFIIQSV